MDDRTFRTAMGKFATGVTVITTEHDSQIHGMTANAFMSVSLNPRLVLVSIDEKANMKRYVEEAGKFAISILSKEQQELSAHFAGQIKKKVEINFDRLNDLPIIKDSLVYVTCIVHNSIIAGDHTLFIGEVTEVSINDGDPLAFFDGKYKQVSELTS